MFHHSWGDVEKALRPPFPYIKDHALLPKASSIIEADKRMRQKITPRTLSKIVDALPDEWLKRDDTDLSPDDIRDVYRRFLIGRLAESRIFVEQAEQARNSI